MEISKKQSVGACAPTEEDLAQINRFARRTLTAEEVYTFAVKLCDNEVDRDGERFSNESLEQLAALFVGKSGIFDHEWSADGQTARIYRAEVVEEDAPTAAGDRYRYVKGCAYMLRSGKNADLIAEIEGGIKKEVSVGCSVARSVCSICGKDIAACGHEKGRRYGGKLCFAELQEALDAYEWSFVAVPAQREAGVMKRFGRERAEQTLGVLIRQHGSRAQRQELKRLEELAAMGERYLKELRGEVARLLLTAEETLDGQTVRGMTEKLDEPELRELARVYGAQVAKKLGTTPQLGAAKRTAREENESDFRV